MNFSLGSNLFFNQRGLMLYKKWRQCVVED